jgi:hypothetical protein
MAKIEELQSLCQSRRLKLCDMDTYFFQYNAEVTPLAGDKDFDKTSVEDEDEPAEEDLMSADDE